MALKSYEELIKVDVRQYCEERDGFTYLNWAKCIELLRQNGATEVYWEPIPDPQTGSSLRKTDIEFKDKNNNTNRCYETRIKVVIDDKEYEMQTPVMNGANPVKDNSMSQQRVWNSMCRAFVKCVAIHTGLGFNLWLKEEYNKLETYKENETLATLQDFFNAPDDTSGTDFMHPFYGAKGSLGTSTWFNTKFLSLKSAGQQVGRANGGLRTIILPADSTGDQEGCQNFYSYFHILFYAGLMGQTGEMCINYLTADDKLIAGVNWYKSDMSGNTGHYDLVCYNPNKKSTDQQAGRVLKTYTYMTSHLRKQNPWYWNWGHCDLRKEGSKLTFFYNGSYPSFNIPEIADMKCAKIQIAIKQRGTRSGNKYLTYNGINAFYFQKLHVKKWRDVPNKFAQDCSLIANCSDGSIRMNGLPKPDLGALGNDWETFCLKPGVNQVQCLYSSWAKKPTFKMKYREVFL